MNAAMLFKGPTIFYFTIPTRNTATRVSKLEQRRHLTPSFGPSLRSHVGAPRTSKETRNRPNAKHPKDAKNANFDGSVLTEK